MAVELAFLSVRCLATLLQYLLVKKTTHLLIATRNLHRRSLSLLNSSLAPSSFQHENTGQETAPNGRSPTNTPSDQHPHSPRYLLVSKESDGRLWLKIWNKGCCQKWLFHLHVPTQIAQVCKEKHEESRCDDSRCPEEENRLLKAAIRSKCLGIQKTQRAIAGI